MNNPLLIGAVILLSVSTGAQTNAPAAATNAPAAPKTISIQEMLVVGHSSLKLHSLAMITQGKAKGGVDESFLPGFKVCAEDSAVPVRSVTARLLGEHFVEGKATPNPEAMALLIKLASDESPFVRFNAVYHGLAPLKDKSPEVIRLLVEVTATDRDYRLDERVAAALENDREAATEILNEKLNSDKPIGYFEVYEILTGKKPEDTARFLDMPCSRPVMFVFTGKEDEDSNAFKTKLQNALKTLGLAKINLTESGAGKSYVLMLKTYVTRDRLAVENAFSSHPEFAPPQIWWLTPDLEAQFDEMSNK